MPNSNKYKIMDINSIDYFSIKNTIDELIKIGEKDIVDKLLDILSKNELPKTELHNRKNDITTSYFKIELDNESLEIIRDLFLDLEISSLTEEGESTSKTEHYVTLLNNWLSISR